VTLARVHVLLGSDSFFMNTEARKKLSKALKAKWASGTRKLQSMESRDRGYATLRRRYETGELKHHGMSEEGKKSAAAILSQKHKGKVLRKCPISEAEKKKLKAVADRFRASDPRAQKGPQNQSARVWKLRSPENQTYQFRNLTHFIRENESLFNSEDVIWKLKRESIPSSWTCKAYGGLAMLSPRRKHCVETWKGWRWHIDGHHQETLHSVLPLSNCRDEPHGPK
jgi:hypothetical protein